MHKVRVEDLKAGDRTRDMEIIEEVQGLDSVEEDEVAFRYQHRIDRGLDIRVFRRGMEIEIEDR